MEGQNTRRCFPTSCVPSLTVTVVTALFARVLAALDALWASGRAGQLCIDGARVSACADLTPPPSHVALDLLPPLQASSPELDTTRPRAHSADKALMAPWLFPSVVPEPLSSP